MLGVHHSAICTADVERSLRFWRDGLGLRQLFDHTFTGDWPELFGAKTDRLRSVFLGDPQTPDSGIVELVELSGANEALPASPGPGMGSSYYRCSATSTRRCPRWRAWASPTASAASRWRPRPKRRYRWP